MAKGLETECLSREEVESHFVSKWGYNPEGLYRINSSIILYCDAALQLKERGYEAVAAIKNAGVPYARIFEMMGYVSSEIDFSHYKRKMQEPEIDAEELEKLSGKETILTDMDFVTGETLQKVGQYLKNRKVKVRGAYIGLENWRGRPDFGEDDNFWIIEKEGLRRLNPERQTHISRDFEIYTSTEPGRINEAIKRVLEYIKKAGKI